MLFITVSIGSWKSQIKQNKIGKKALSRPTLYKARWLVMKVFVISKLVVCRKKKKLSQLNDFNLALPTLRVLFWLQLEMNTD